jgi:hypothetical protein
LAGENQTPENHHQEDQQELYQHGFYPHRGLAGAYLTDRFSVEKQYLKNAICRKRYKEIRERIYFGIFSL